MNDPPEPDTATAFFRVGAFTVRLSFPSDQAASWRAATPSAVLERLGLAVGVPSPVDVPNGVDAARKERGRPCPVGPTAKRKTGH